jgi:hypothetical protein
VKRIIHYVVGTLDHGLYYSDSDHFGNIDTSKSMSGILFFFVKCLVSLAVGHAAGGGLVQL